MLAKLKFKDLFELNDYQRYLKEQLEYYHKLRDVALEKWIEHHTKKNQDEFDYYDFLINVFKDQLRTLDPLYREIHRLETSESILEYINRQRRYIGLKVN